MSIVTDTLRQLEKAAKDNSQVLVGYSGGKDSRAVMDLCSRTFETVVGFHMYFVPGLKVIREQIDYAKERWKVPMMFFPHWGFFKAYTSGLYCDPGHVFDDVGDYSLPHIHAAAAKEAGIKLIAHGGKKRDGLWRKWALNHHKNQPYEMLYPIVEWTKYDVLAYLKAQNIPIPDSASPIAGGIGLDTATLLWLHDHHLEDFEKIEVYFPYIRAVVCRREWYGVQ